MNQDSGMHLLKHVPSVYSVLLRSLCTYVAMWLPADTQCGKCVMPRGNIFAEFCIFHYPYMSLSGIVAP